MVPVIFVRGTLGFSFWGIYLLIWRACARRDEKSGLGDLGERSRQDIRHKLHRHTACLNRFSQHITIFGGKLIAPCEVAVKTVSQHSGLFSRKLCSKSMI